MPEGIGRYRARHAGAASRKAKRTFATGAYPRPRVHAALRIQWQREPWTDRRLVRIADERRHFMRHGSERHGAAMATVLARASLLKRYGRQRHDEGRGTVGRGATRYPVARRRRTRLDRRPDRGAGIRWRRSRRRALHGHGCSAGRAERRDKPVNQETRYYSICCLGLDPGSTWDRCFSPDELREITEARK